AHVHPARVALHRGVDEPLDLGERDDLVELRLDLAPPHPEHRAVQVDVVAARELRVETGADLEQRADGAADARLAGGRHGDARQDLEQRRLARAVVADDADGPPALDPERRVPEGPDLLPVAPERRAPALAEDVPLAEPLRLDGEVR